MNGLSAFSFAAEEFLPKKDYLADPAGWVVDKTGAHLWSGQREILESVRVNRYTAVQSCHDAGKSYIASRAVAWWLDSHPDGDAFVVTTAPTAAQVSAILWREIAKAHKKAGLRGKITSAGYPQWKLDDGELVGYGRKPADYSDDAFQGIHARAVLIVLDEACGIPINLYNAVDALATNEYARVLAIGNPDDPTSHFAQICKPDSGWHSIRLDGLRTPNFTEGEVARLSCPQCTKSGRSENLLQELFRVEGLPYVTEKVPDDLRPMLLSPLWVEERLHRWVGRPNETTNISVMSARSALFTSKVRGLFPTSASDGVIPLGWVEAAMARHNNWVDAGCPPVTGAICHGVDVARKGEDETCVATRIGDCLTQIRKFAQADTMETTGYVTGIQGAFGGRIVVDSIGIGAGVLDRLRELGVPVVGFVASGSADGMRDKTREFKFLNLRAAAWWSMRELLDPSNNSRLMLPDDEMLKADLTTPMWKVLSSGKIQVESKEDIRHRLGRSTDAGDAVIHAFWVGRGTMDATDNVGALSWWSAPDARSSVHRWYTEDEALQVNPDVSVGWSTAWQEP